MKFLLIAFTLLVSSLSFADLRSYDCNRAVDGYGGRICDSTFVECHRSTCEEAISCIVKKIHLNDAGQTVRVAPPVRLSETQIDGDTQTIYGVQSVRENCNGRQCLTPMYVYTRILPSTYAAGAGECQPTVIELLGDTSIGKE